MGIVYLARDVALDRPVAIKLLPPALAAQPDYRARFLREARTAAGLSHPNIVPIHLVEEKAGLVYFVMAFIDGESLGDRVRRAGPLKPADAAKLVQDVAWALAYAHSRGVIHCDVKPDNILIDKGSARALVTDFGIVCLTPTGAMSQQGPLLGTPRYLSPEQASAEAEIDGRADLYSLGVTAFFALTGRLPFESQNRATLVAMHIAEPAPPVRSVCSIVPARLAQAVDRCLAKDPTARFPSGEALAEAIAEAQVTRGDIAPITASMLWFVDPLLSDLARNGFSIAWVFKALLPAATGAFTLGMAIAPKGMIAALTRGTPESAGFWRQLWAGPVGRWLFRLVGIGLKKGKALPVPESAPTEVVLGRAAAELFEQLPRDERARLGDVHEVIRGLERAATALRARREELRRTIADVGEPEGAARRVPLVTELTAAERRLASAVTALENLRLDLLRLRSGVGHPDDLTAAIAEARSVGEAADVELAARQEVESLTGLDSHALARRGGLR